MNNKDKIIQICVDSENGMTGLSESGKVYDFIPQGYKKTEKGYYAKDENGKFILDDTVAHWKLLIDSPEQQR